MNTKTNIHNEIVKKFSYSKQKWFKIKKTEKNIKLVKKTLKNFLKQDSSNKKDVLNLLTFFKYNDYIWAKYKNVIGKNKIVCNCSFVTLNKQEIKFKSSPEFILSCEALEGTPKSLDLFNKNKLVKKPKDSFSDHITSIEAWEEFTDAGYKEYVFEVKNKLIYTDKKNYWCKYK